MGIFSKIFGKKKAFELPVGVERDKHGRFIDIAPATLPEPKQVKVTVNVVKNPGTSATCACGGGTCECEKRKAAYAKSVAEKQKKATATKPTKLEQVKADAERMQNKPVAKKAPAKKKPKAE